MSRARGAEAPVAQEQWRGLHATLSKLDCRIELVPPQPKLPDMGFSPPTPDSLWANNLSQAIFGTKERAGEAPHFASWMEKRGFQVSWLPMIFISKAKAMHFSSATHFFAVTNSGPTSNRIARSRRCSAVLSSQWNLSIRVFIISTLAFARCPTARRFGFPLLSMNTASTPFASTFPIDRRRTGGGDAFLLQCRRD